MERIRLWQDLAMTIPADRDGDSVLVVESLAHGPITMPADKVTVSRGSNPHVLVGLAFAGIPTREEEVSIRMALELAPSYSFQCHRPKDR